MTGRVKRRQRLIRPAATLSALAALGISASMLGDKAFGALPVWKTLAAMLLYLLAHVLRALRLGIIAGPLLGISVRTTAALHFVCAPLVTLIPMKIGELVRLQQLWLIGQRLSGAVIALLIDRVLDATMLLGLLGWFALIGHPAINQAYPVLQLTALAVGLAGMVLVLAPRMLASLQRYVLIHHQSATLLRSLPVIDTLRRGADEGRVLARRQGAPLLVISACIWMLELAAAAIFTTAVLRAELRNPGVLLLERATQEWQIATGAGVDPAYAASAASGILVVMACWPVAIWIYTRRIGAEPQRLRRPPNLPEAAHGA